MPPRLRFAPPSTGCYWLHLTQRGNNKQPVFTADQDRHHFLTLVGSLSEERQVRVASYTLMTNHFCSSPDHAWHQLGGTNWAAPIGHYKRLHPLPTPLAMRFQMYRRTRGSHPLTGSSGTSSPRNRAIQRNRAIRRNRAIHGVPRGGTFFPQIPSNQPLADFLLHKTTARTHFLQDK